MKKFIKKSSLFIITLLCTILVDLANVEAFDNCEDAVASGYTCKMVGDKPIVASPSQGYNPGKTTEFEKAKENVKTFGDLNMYVKKADGTPLAGSSNYKYYSYTGATDGAGNPVYCLDANKGGATNLYAARFIGDDFNNKEGEKSINTYIHDIAIMEILTSKADVSPSSDEYRSVSLAIRSVNQLFGLSQTTSANNKECEYANLVTGQNKEQCLQSKANDDTFTKAIVGTMNDWVSNGDESVKNSYNTIRDAIPGGAFFDVNKNDNPKGYTLADDGGTLVSDAQALFNQALAKAAKAATNATAEEGSAAGFATVTPSNGEVLNGGVQVTSTAEGEMRSLQMKYNFKLSNFTSDSKASLTFNNLGYADGAEAVGASAEPKIADIKVNGQSICSGECSLGQNILDGLNIEGDADIEVILQFEGNANDLKCGGQPMNFNLDYSFSDSNSSDNLFPGYTGVVWYAHNDKEGKITNEQRYISVTKNGDEGSEPEGVGDTLSGEVNLTEACDCSALADACSESGSSGSDACGEFFDAGCGNCDVLKVQAGLGDADAEKEFEATCDITCDTYFTTFECCDSNNLIVSTLDDKETKILGPGPDNPDANSIKACFVSSADNQKSVDKDGNSEKGYIGATSAKDQKDNTYTSHQLKENKYCVVSCKEDYIMTMPTAKMVNAGRYFTFKAKVEGTKACYTNTIDREQYNKDIIKLQEKMVNDYNEYRKWYQLAVEENYGQDTASYVSGCPGDCCGSESTTDYKPTWNSTATVDDWQVIVDRDFEKGAIKVEEKEQGVDNSHEYEYEEPYPSASASVSSGCCGGCSSCKPPEPCEKCSGYSCTYFTGTRPIHIKESEYKGYLMDKANAAKAVLDATREEYQRTIELYHECTNDSWTSEMNYQPNVYYDYQETYLSKFGLIGQMEEQIGATSTDSEWFCEGKDNVDKDYENCSGASSSSREQTLEKINYVVCYAKGDESECKIEDRKEYYDISKANYAKKESKVEANYKPKTLFYNVYPSGEIVINKADDNVALDNSLPVGLNTDRGIYKYTVNVENLGEFYDDPSGTNLGRYVGAPKAVVDPNTLIYNCAYLVNIISESGWTCAFDETCTDNCISNCIGPNCGEDYCKDGNCVHECVDVGCIYDTNAGSSILEKTVSLSNLFPNGTTAYNWNKDKNEKAASTISEIEGAGNTVYDEKPILSVTMDGSSAAALRRYNKSVENEGGYSNATLDCYALGGYQEIACYSRVITDYMGGTYGGTVNESVATDSRNVGDNNTDYFTLWNGTISDKSMIGPAHR